MLTKIDYSMDIIFLSYKERKTRSNVVVNFTVSKPSEYLSRIPLYDCEAFKTTISDFLVFGVFSHTFVFQQDILF